MIQKDLGSIFLFEKGYLSLELSAQRRRVSLLHSPLSQEPGCFADITCQTTLHSKFSVCCLGGTAVTASKGSQGAFSTCQSCYRAECEHRAEQQLPVTPR